MRDTVQAASDTGIRERPIAGDAEIVKAGRADEKWRQAVGLRHALAPVVLVSVGLLTPGLAEVVCTLFLAWSIVTLWRVPGYKPGLIALAFTLLVVELGYLTHIEYLGIETIDPQVRQWSAVATTAIAAGLHLGARNSRLASDIPPNPIKARTLVLLSCLSTGGFALRFALSGAPLLLGDASRHLAQSRPLQLLDLACAVGAVVPPLIAQTPAPNALRLALAVNAAAVLGTASRLLIAAVVVANIYRVLAERDRDRHVARAYRRRAGAIIGLLLALIAVRLIYSSRTATGVEAAYHSRLLNGAGPVAVVAEQVMGAGSLVSARNGPVVGSLLLAADADPFGPFLKQDVSYLTLHGEDPELTVTSLLGLPRSSVGSTAVPLQIQAGLSGGPLGAACLGIIIGGIYSWLSRTRGRGPLALWWAFGMAASAYGSYLVSRQFLAVLVALLLLKGTERARAEL